MTEHVSITERRDEKRLGRERDKCAPLQADDLDARSFVSVAEFCRKTGLSASTVRRRIAEGTLVVYQPGGPRSRVLIHISAIEGPLTPPPTPPEPPAAKTNQLPGPAPRWRMAPVMENRDATKNHA
jgi:hypothetical protein